MKLMYWLMNSTEQNFSLPLISSKNFSYFQKQAWYTCPLPSIRSQEFPRSWLLCLFPKARRYKAVIRLVLRLPFLHVLLTFLSANWGHLAFNFHPPIPHAFILFFIAVVFRLYLYLFCNDFVQHVYPSMSG